MELAINTVCPPTLWAQTKDRLLLTFLVQDTKDAEVKFEANKVIFSGKGGTDNTCCAVELQLWKEIDPEQSKWDRTSRHVTAVAIKKESGPFWPRLLDSKVKQHWLKVDFDKMRDSDESSDDEMGQPGQPNLSEMMAQMGRGTGSTNFDDLEPDDDESEDSDDEELPGLETAEPTSEEALKVDETDEQACKA